MSRVNILGEALEGLGRWYVAVPPFLIIGFLAALFFLTGAGQQRLQEASGRLQQSAVRAQAIEELQTAISRSVASQRGFLLTGDGKFLRGHDKIVADVEPRLERLRVAYEGSADDLADVRNLHVLIGKRLADLSMLVAIQKSQGAAAAIALVRTSVGSDTGEALNDVLEQMRHRESLRHADAEAYWSQSLILSRWVTVAGTIFNMLLVGIAARLVYMDLRRRTLQTAELRDEKVRLEREAEEHNRELVELSTHLQSVAEREKASLARELHDELGGLLVGARMDISWAEENLKEGDTEVQRRLRRVQENLSAGVDLKRRIIEELRPTLLDEVGLFAALRWQMKESCGRAGLKCMESYPDEEPKFTSEAAIALFRVAQEAFTNILKHSAAASVDITLSRVADDIVMQISDDGKGIPAGRLSAVGSHGVVSMRHRVRALNGRLDMRSSASGGTVLLVQIPVSNSLAPPLDGAQ
ncbi:MAG: CHASE3 domain-containing protein [Steroidobacteraceae bacterium]